MCVCVCVCVSVCVCACVRVCRAKGPASHQVPSLPSSIRPSVRHSSFAPNRPTHLHSSSSALSRALSFSQPHTLEPISCISMHAHAMHTTCTHVVPNFCLALPPSLFWLSERRGGGGRGTRVSLRAPSPSSSFQPSVSLCSP